VTAPKKSGTEKGDTASGDLATTHEGTAARRRPRWPGRVLRGAALLLVAAAVLLVSGVLPVQAIRIPTDSMTPAISPGDHLLLDKRDGAGPAVGDVVVVTDPLGDGLIVKRVVAVGGDTIGFEDGILVRNGRAVDEPYTTDFLDGVYYGPDVVPPGQLYLLGDNRFDSEDSRNFGPVAADSVVGRVVGRLFPSPGSL
jgi:signal peptidase I